VPASGSTIDAQTTEIYVPLPLAAVREVFAARPAKWLRPFLSLAAHRGTGQPLTAGSPTGFRLGRPIDDELGEVVFDFTWWAHLRGGLFESFRGQFHLRREHEGAVLRLDGPVYGGSPERNAAVLTALLELLAEALTADQVPIG
jgi:hypothetical protein